MDTHPMDRREAVIIRKVQTYDVQYERGVGGIDGMLGPEVQRNAILPGFQLAVESADGVEQFAVGLP